MVRLKDSIPNHWNAYSCVISIPVWCDWRKNGTNIWNCENYISIPVWCDWRFSDSMFCICLYNFNSSMVRLKDLLGDFRLKFFEIFQFQYGAIEGIAECSYSITDTISIPVWCDWRYLTELLNFTVIHYFNSSMVRLKGSFWANTPLVAKSFQFQYGAIEGVIGIGWNGLIIEISIPVWCDWRQSPLPSTAYRYRNFNSSMVRLKECPAPSSCRSTCYFNSSMVRLKGFCGDRWCQVNIFQFQYGAIEGAHAVHGIGWHHHWFQFQYGAIEGRDIIRGNAGWSLFQFQYGAIEGKNWSTVDLAAPISIPVWCDWRT